MSKKILGYELNLDNPKTFNEKIQWLQLNNRIPLKTFCADKYSVRDYIKDKIGEQYLIPLVYHTDNPANIIPENLPGYPFIIKSNHGCGGHIIVKDKSIIDWKRVQKYLKKSLKSNFYYKTKEWQYKDIEPRVLVEKLLLDENSNIPDDYKFNCFNGKVEIISADMNRHIDLKRNVYDKDWNFIDCRLRLENGGQVKKPYMLNKMKSLAEALAQDFKYVRVDLYNIDSKIYFGELTFSPAAGFQQFIPEKWDRILGNKLVLH
ncbi:ATP-grasp fold amidoligase family protein [Candidatus Neomarinimicrobiota bacterium]